MSGPLVVLGDVLLDREIVGTVDRLCPEAPVPVLAERSVRDRPGGAGLAALFAADGPTEVVVVAGFSADAGGQRLRQLLGRAGVRVVALPLRGPTVEKIRLRSGSHLLLRLDRGDCAPAQLGPVPPQALAALRSAAAVLVSDYGRGVAGHPELAAALRECAARVPVVWDPHPLGAAPTPGARLVTPNRSEAAGFVAALPTASPSNGKGNGNGHSGGAAPQDAAADAERLRRHWEAGAVVVTLGERGAVLSTGDGPCRTIGAPFPAQGDPCGAGDRFASTAATALAGGASAVDAVRAAVDAATAYVAAGGALATDDLESFLTGSDR